MYYPKNMDNKVKKLMLIIFGPTGVGKSDLADKIAQQIPAEIINMDVGQLYTPLTIGTAKPQWQKSSITHHMFDVVDQPKNFTVTQYRSNLKAIVNNCWKHNKLPIIVGGSGFYLKSILFPPRPEVAQKISTEELEDVLKKVTWEQLHNIDPDRAKQIHPNDHYRIARAVEIWLTTGKKPSQYKPTFAPLGDFILIFLTRDRKELYDRIDYRVLEMIQNGWITEVEQLQGTDWIPFLKNKKLIGYDDIIEYLQTKKNPEKIIKKIQKRTRNYAKRQHTFWNMLQDEVNNALIKEKKVKAHVESVNLTATNFDVYIKQLLNRLSSSEPSNIRDI